MNTVRAKYSTRDPTQTPYRRAVVVIKVADETAAHAAGLQPGTFVSHDDKLPVQTPAEFHPAVQSATGLVTLRLHSDRPTEARSVIVRE